MNSQKPSGSEKSTESKVLVSTPFFVPAFLGGGPIQTLKALINAAPSGFDTKVICSNHDLGKTAPLTDHPNQWVDVGPAKVCYVQGSIRNHINALQNTSDSEIIYLNSLFNPRYSILPMLLKKLGFWKKGTLLIAPRGELDPGALALKTPKKKTFIAVFKLLRFHKITLWHASTPAEASQIKQHFGDVTVLVRENETSLPQYAFNRPARKPGSPRLLFVSRLDEKKGLHILLESLKGITNEVELKIVGAFENDEYEARCRRLITEIDDNISIEFLGPLEREDVLHRMQSADLLVFPTAGENFGHVIAEALSQSCPVMCSANTPWNRWLKSGGGYSVQANSSSAWKEHIEDFISGGVSRWKSASSSAGETFDNWRNEDKGTHVFALATAALK